MNVVITGQSLDRLEENLIFYLEELEMPKEKVDQIKEQLPRKVKSLGNYSYKGQKDLYLKKLNKGHRSVIEGNFKIIYRIENETHLYHRFL